MGKRVVYGVRWYDLPTLLVVSTERVLGEEAGARLLPACAVPTLLTRAFALVVLSPSLALVVTMGVRHAVLHAERTGTGGHQGANRFWTSTFPAANTAGWLGLSAAHVTCTW